MNKNNLAFVFPGQGSQTVGMLYDFAAQHPEVVQLFHDASKVLQYDLWQLVQNGPEEALNQTQHTQPALLVASYAVWQVFKKQNLNPGILAGHSLGEYTALLCAEALSFEDAVKLVAARGQYMQQAVENIQGAMAAIIGLSDDNVASLCVNAKEDDEILSPANYNSHGQVVIAGHKGAVDRALLLAKEMGAKMAVSIPVSVPSHCSLMRPAAEKLSGLLASIDIQLPRLTVINNADVESYTSADQIRQGLVRQLYMPVRWVETIEYFKEQGVVEIVECGPGKVLTGLNKRIDKSLQLKTFDQIAKAS